MATLPRTILPTDVTRPTLRDPLIDSPHRGGVLTRDPLQAGVRWREEYSLLKAGRVNDEALLAFISRYASTGTAFDVKHLLTPGSGIAPNGTGTSGITVSGASQTGSSLVTTGWPVTTNNVSRAGDWIAVAGLLHRLKVLEDADSDGSGNATLIVGPAIWAGISPANAAAITTTDITFRVKVVGRSRTDATSASFYYGGVWVVYEEAL